MQCTRRDFMKAGLSSMAYFTTVGSVPAWIAKSAAAMAKDLPSDNILVIVQLGGGNDGLNTVVPYTDDLYLGNELRPNLHITNGLDNTVLDNLNALHPRLANLKTWWDRGNLAVVNNVGYPNPNLSHFVSTSFWERGVSPDADLDTNAGWMARFFDNACAGAPEGEFDALTQLMAGKSSLPETYLGSDYYVPPAVSSFGSYSFRVPGGTYGEHIRNSVAELNNIQPINGEIDFLQRSFNTAAASIEDIAAASAIPAIYDYPSSSFGRGFDIVSKVIRGGFATKIFYVKQSGYDTHANQVTGSAALEGTHADLLGELDLALNAFLGDMMESGNLDRVTVMTFSEFGRRVAESDSRGTDHGAAGCLFVMGGKVQKGIYGGQPDLVNLQKGNLKHTVDYRAVYARVIQDWLHSDPEPIFGATDFNRPDFAIKAGMDIVPLFAPAGPAEDVDGDGSVNAVDVQHVINDALGGTSGMPTDLNGDNVTDAVDVQMVVNAALAK